MSWIVVPADLLTEADDAAGVRALIDPYCCDAGLVKVRPNGRSGCGGQLVTPRVTESLIKLIKLQLSPNARLNQDTKV
jgi:hypothetical protein